MIHLTKLPDKNSNTQPTALKQLRSYLLMNSKFGYDTDYKSNITKQLSDGKTIEFGRKRARLAIDNQGKAAKLILLVQNLNDKFESIGDPIRHEIKQTRYDRDTELVTNQIIDQLYSDENPLKKDIGSSPI
ncbi:MAG: hypothetical protein MK033_09385 [Candidatus Caenarcaniphilales bacterium]|nr:hypothetical protein [Candidatus Caenarcaniphilales bacterium]